jgi:hypothetical protein
VGLWTGALPVFELHPLPTPEAAFPGPERVQVAADDHIFDKDARSLRANLLLVMQHVHRVQQYFEWRWYQYPAGLATEAQAQQEGLLSVADRTQRFRRLWTSKLAPVRYIAQLICYRFEMQDHGIARALARLRVADQHIRDEFNVGHGSGGSSGGPDNLGRARRRYADLRRCQAYLHGILERLHITTYRILQVLQDWRNFHPFCDVTPLVAALQGSGDELVSLHDFLEAYLKTEFDILQVATTERTEWRPCRIVNTELASDPRQGLYQVNRVRPQWRGK